jgi:signal transduction histidine kinase
VDNNGYLTHCGRPDTERERPGVLLDTSPVGAFLVSCDGALLECNRTFASQAGLGARQAAGHTLRSLLGDADWPVHAAALKRCAEHAEPVRYEVLLPQGWRAFALYPVAAALGRVACVAGYALDLSGPSGRRSSGFAPDSALHPEECAGSGQDDEQPPEPAPELAAAPAGVLSGGAVRRADAAGQPVHAVQNSGGAAVGYISPSGRLLQLSAALCTMLGGSHDQLRGSDFALSFNENDRPAVRERLRAGVGSGVEGVAFEARLNALQDEDKWCRVHCLGVCAAEDKPLFGIVVAEDVSHIRRLRAEAVRAGQLASLGELAAGVAHEINNPVNGIINYAQLLLDAAESRKAQAEAGIARKIIKEGSRIADIAHNLLFFARDRRQEMTLLRPEAVLLESLDLTRAMISRDGITLQIAVEPDLPMVRGRSRELQQVFLNVISNARYALNRRFATPCPEKHLAISLRSRRGGEGMVVAEFVDQGGGIPGHLRARVLEPFFSTKPEREGTGLGLSISQSIIRAHGGLLELYSDGHTYTRVQISLPTPTGAQ